MPDYILCSECRRRISLPEDFARETVRCPSCKALVTISGSVSRQGVGKNSSTSEKEISSSRQPGASATPRRPSKVPKNSSSEVVMDVLPVADNRMKWLLIVGGGALTLVAIGMIVGAIVWFSRNNEPDPSAIAANSKPAVETPTDTRSESPLTGEQIYKRLLRSTVFIVAGDGVGSGSLIHAEKKLVLTNNHVAGHASNIAVFFPVRDATGKVISEVMHYARNKDTLAIPGKVVKASARQDLALIQLESLPQGVKALPLLRESSNPGQNVHSIGASGIKDGVLWRYTTGQVRQIHKLAAGEFNAFVLETQSPINPGDSGGPVVNDRCQLAAVVCMYNTQERLVSDLVDIREVRPFLAEYFNSIGAKWEDAPFISPVGDESQDIQRLISDLANPDNETRMKAVRRLGASGPDAQSAVPALLTALTGGTEALRQTIAAALEQIGPPSQAESRILLGAMRGNDRIARLYALRTWSRQMIPPREAVPLLIISLKDTDAGVRAMSATALGKFGPDCKTDAVPVLIPALGDTDAGVTRNVREALDKIGPYNRTDLDLFRGFLTDKTLAIRTFVVEKLVQLNLLASDAVKIWQFLLADRDEDIRSQAINQLTALGTLAAPARADLIKCFAETSPRMRREVIHALVATGVDQSITTAIAARLTDQDATVRNEAAEALAGQRIGGKEDLPLLMQLLRGQNTHARTTAADALAKFGIEAKSAVPDLIIALQDPDSALRLASVKALAAIGPDALPALPALIALLHESGSGTSAESAAGSGSEKVVDRLFKSAVWIYVTTGALPVSESGCLIDASEKLVLTNYHTVKNSREIVVFFPAYNKNGPISRLSYYLVENQSRKGKSIGQVVSSDPRMDLALLRLTGNLPTDVRPLSLAQASIQAGADVHTIGAQGVNLRGHVGRGGILGDEGGTLWRYARGKVKQSQKRQIHLHDQIINASLVETLAPINVGDSGMPLVNDQSELVAVYSALEAYHYSYGVDIQEVREFLAGSYKAMGKTWHGAPLKNEAAEARPADPNKAAPPSPELRKAAIVAISNLGPPAIPVLLKELKNKSSQPFWKDVVTVLGQFGTAAEAAIPDLTLLLADTELQESVSEALSQMGPKVLPALKKFVGDHSSVMRLGIAITLGRMGAAAKPAVPVLQDMVTYDKSRDVRQAAQDALRKIKQ